MLFLSKRLLHPFCSTINPSKTIHTPLPRGKLMVVPTPIGNLADLSPNIIKALFQADLIACQDSRVAGQLYHLIQRKGLVQEMEKWFGSLGLSDIVPVDQQDVKEAEQAHLFYNYSNMTDSQRRKFLRKMPIEQQTTFRLNFLKYRASKTLNKTNQWLYPSSQSKFDELYGIDLSDMKHIQTQIYNTRRKKGRGVLIPLNTYNQTKMFQMVRAMLENKKVALVSDAGMPCISDPGWKLINKIRNTMPDVPIQVVPGPSSVSILALQASVCSKNNSLSGRFQGFSSLHTGYYQQKHRDVVQNKIKEFSIHFINANKLKARLLEIEKVFGGQHRIIVNNQMTKKFQRRFEGTISELLDKIDEPQFKPIGEISYLLYPPEVLAETNIKQEETHQVQKAQQTKKQQVKQETTGVDLNRRIELPIATFLSILQQHAPKLPNKQKVHLLTQIYGIKTGRARQYVYQKYSQHSN